MSTCNYNYDVIVVGGGHAACEAALASARVGAKTLMITINLDHTAQMSCNPAVGGIAKGHVVREIDALGGAQGMVTDAAAIQFRMLNRTKGAAVWSPRAQCDKVCYQRAMKLVLERQPNLTIKQAMVTGLLLEDGQVAGVTTNFGDAFHSSSVVIGTGTFLNGKLHYGLYNMPGGRAGDPPSVELANCLRDDLKLRIGRLKTGTPPRILAKSIDFAQMQRQEAEDHGELFSHFPVEAGLPRADHTDMPCYLVHSTKTTADLVNTNLDRAPMYQGNIEGIGTRYCPSFEDKVVRFPHHEQHLLYLEPEGEYTEEYYINGISTSLPPDVQVAMLQSIPGLENAELSRYAYAIEYDFVFPDQLHRGLGLKEWPSLFLAGQINGTSGYEEAAGQGLVAGLNAARHAQGKAPVEFQRDTCYIGVMIDDLVTKDIIEPYRLFTSRAEYRLRLRQDNADLRLCEFANDHGLLSTEKYNAFQAYKQKLNATTEKAKAQRQSGKSLWEHLRDRQGDFDAEQTFDLAELELDTASRVDAKILRQMTIQSHYEGYIKREDSSIAKLKKLEDWPIPAEFDYSAIKGLRNESRLKLTQVKPSTLAQASRIDGVTPAEIALLQVHLSR